MEVSSSSRRVEIEELAELFRSPEMAAVGPVAVAPLPEGHGVRGWLWSASRRRPSAFSRTSGCGCWKGFPTARRWRSRRLVSRGTASRASMWPTRCSSTPERSLATTGDDVEERIVRLAAEILDANEVSLWLQAEPGEALAAVAVWDDDEDHRALVLAARFPAGLRSRSRSAGALPAPSRAVRGDPRRDGAQPGGDVAVAPFVLGEGRMGFLVAGAPAGETFGELS